MKYYFFLILTLSMCFKIFAQDDFIVSKSYLAWEKERLEKKRGINDYPYQKINRTLEIKVWFVENSRGNVPTDITEINKVLVGVNEYFKHIGLSFKVCSQEIIHDYYYSLLTDSSNIEMNGKTGDTYTYNTKPAIDDSNIRLMVNSYYEPHVINIYYVDDIIVKNFDTVAGLAYLPTTNGINEKYDCVFISKLGLSADVHAHELGHFFGLYHTHEYKRFGNEFVDGSNCATAGDLICDTPAEYDLKDAVYLPPSSCNLDPYLVPSDPKGQRYVPNIGNIMSYSRCIWGFSKEQYKKMIEVYFTYKTYLR